MGFFRRLSKRVLWIINVVLVALFLISAWVQHANPRQFPLFSLFSLTFPYLLLLVAVFMCWWLFVKSRWALLSGIAIILCSGAITNFFAFNSYASFEKQKADGHIRVATWNVARFIEMIKNNNKGSQTRYKMLQQIRNENADILCFQEFSSSINPDWYNNIIAVNKGLGYPHYYFSHDWDGDRLFNGSVIFSRYPIVDTGMVRYPRPTLPDALVFADINVNGKTIRVYTTHLQSNQFRKEDITKIDELKGGKGVLGNSSHIFSKLALAINHRSIQADLVADVVSDSPYPSILCGDLNDVPNSYVYKTIKGSMQDAFLQKGFGIGRTFNSIAPTLRIDYIFADREFEISQFKRITTGYSDHYMLVADVAFKSPANNLKKQLGQ